MTNVKGEAASSAKAGTSVRVASACSARAAIRVLEGFACNVKVAIRARMRTAVAMGLGGAFVCHHKVTTLAVVATAW